MALSLLNRAVSNRPADLKLKLPKVPIPDLDRFIIAEVPAIAVQLAPALEDLAALTDGIPADLQQQIEGALQEQIGATVPGAAVVSVAVGEKPDYALLRKDPETLSPDEKGRLALESLKLLGRRQNFGIFLGAEGRSGLPGRRKGTQAVDLGIDVGPLINKTGAPFEIKILTAEIVKAANALIEADAPRYSLQGEECGCGPVAVQSVAIRNPSAGKLELVVNGQLDLLLGAAHAGFELHVNETLAVDDGSLADPKATGNVVVLQIVGAQLPEKAKKFLERDVVQALLVTILPIGPLLALALRALASRVATNKLQAGDAVRGPVHDALEKVLAPQMVRGTDQKIHFDLKRTGTPAGAITLAGVVLVEERRQALRIRPLAVGKRVSGEIFDIRFRATPSDMVEPVNYTWACLGQELAAGSEVTFRVDMAANPEFPVTVEAIDADGFPAPAVRSRFRKAGPQLGGRLLLAGEPVRQ